MIAWRPVTAPRHLVFYIRQVAIRMDTRAIRNKQAVIDRHRHVDFKCFTS